MRTYNKQRTRFNPPKVPVIRMNFWSGRKPMDIDGDGVPDHKDCQWWNPKKHSVEPSEETRKRISKMPPIYISKSPGEERYHILSKEAKKLPLLRKEVLGTIKHYPSVLGSIEKSGTPEITYYGSQHPKELGQLGATKLASGSIEIYQSPRLVMTEKQVRDIDKEDIEKNIEFGATKTWIKTRKIADELFLKSEGTSIDSPQEQMRKERTGRAISTFHETQHAKELPEKEKEFREEDKKKIPYYEMPSEIRAIESSEKQFEKYETPYFESGIEKEKLTGFRKLMEEDEDV
jgi:hypothetical protein